VHVAVTRDSLAAELAFALEIAARAGELQMARFERLERIEHTPATLSPRSTTCPRR